MKTRPKPQSINYRQRIPAGLKTDPQVVRWTQRLQGDPTAKPTDLTEEQLTFIHLELLKTRDDFSTRSQDEYRKAMAETCPVIAAPEIERQHLAEDLAKVFAPPEMRDFWSSWQPTEQGARGPRIDAETVKALMATMGACGVSPHADDAYHELTRTDLWGVFNSLAPHPVRSRKPLSYQNALKHMPRLNCTQLAMETNLRMIQRLRELHPGGGVGERLLIDGMALPAWCKQAPKGKTDRQERFFRRHCPEAGARALVQTSRSKRSIRDSDKASASFLRRGKFWRGYYLVALVDQATGLPLVWTVFDAQVNEEQAIVPLLDTLFEIWPDCPAKLIAGDSAWDEDAWCRVCELDYGIHPIFRLHDKNKVPDVSEKSQRGSISAITPEGQLICSRHRKRLEFKLAETPPRTTLDPGRSHAEESRFRVRGECPDGCGSIGLRMDADWSRLTFFPHYPSGRLGQKRYAMRLAMLTRLNGVEGLFQRLQSGKKLGTKGADRTRIRDKGAHEAIVSLGLLSMTAAALAIEREERGTASPPLTPGPAPRCTAPPSRRPRRHRSGSARRHPHVARQTNGGTGGDDDLAEMFWS